MEIVRNLSAAHAERLGGEDSLVVIADSREIKFDHARFLRVNYRRYCPREWFTKREMYVDHLYGLLGLPRPHSAKLFLPAVEAVRREKPAVVVVHEGHHGTPSLVYWQGLRPETLVVLWAHVRLSRSYGKRELRRLLRGADGLVFASDDLRRSVEDRAGPLPSPAVVIHNGIATSIFHSEGRRESSSFRVSYVGEVAEFKGVHLLLKAMHHFASLSPRPLQLTIVGSSRGLPPGQLSAYESSLRDLARNLGLDVRWVSRVPQAELGAIFRDSDVVCVPSVCEEAFGMVVLEALACGAAVVASARGGLPEAGGDAATYVDPTDEQAFATAVARLANDQEHLAEMRRRAAARVADASWDKAYERFQASVELFRDTAARPKRERLRFWRRRPERSNGLRVRADSDQ